ncbi:MAG: hypothetical protein SGPRY_005760 [Prymnesium sp.]
MQPPRPPPQPTRMAKIVRSASFSRRGSKAKGSLEEVAGAKGNEIRTTTEDSSSDSRPLSPDEEPREKEELVARALRREKLEDRPKKLLPPEQMTDDDFAALDLVDNLSGWMSKRHHKKQYQWARRFFIVNDERGTIGYSKGLKGKRARPSVVLSLQDLKSVQLICLTEAKWPIVVSCPPISLTFAAENRAEAYMWVVQLNKRMRMWRARAEARVPVATLSQVSQQADIHPQRREVVLQPRDARAQDRSLNRGGTPGRDSFSRALVQYPPAAEWQASNAPSQLEECSCPSPTSVASSPDEAALAERVHQPGGTPHAAGRQVARPFRADMRTTIEAIDHLDYESDMGSPSPDGGSPGCQCPIDPWAVPTRNLADMLSSGEEEEEEEEDEEELLAEAEPEQAAVASNKLAEFGCPMNGSPPAVMARDTREIADSLEEVRYIDEPLSADDENWDSDEEEQEQATNATHAVQTAADIANVAHVPRIVGDGIEADPNFIEDDWDRDDA